MEQTNYNKQSSNPTQCRNCEYSFTSEAKYCPACGQKNTDGKASLWEVLGVFFSTIFNLESKFFTTMRDIFVPGKLTHFYFVGKRGWHFHPMRLFIVTFLFLVAAIGLQISRDAKDDSIDAVETAEKTVWRYKFIEEVDSLSKIVVTEFPEDREVEVAFDSLHIRLMANSLKNPALDSFDINLLTTSTKITRRDYIELSPDKLIEKHNIESFWERLFVRQGTKLLKDNKSFISFLLSKSIWIMLAMMPFLGLLFKLLYIRRSRYYVEHLIFSFHIHSFAFILLTISILLNVFVGISWAMGLSILGVLVYTFFAMKRVYGQRFGKTFAKFTIVTVAYLFIFTLFLIMGSLISVALF